MLLLSTGFCVGQTSATPCKAKSIEDLAVGGRTTEQIAKRENALHPAMYAEGCKDYQRAYNLYQKVLADYPNDASVMQRTARAAIEADKLEEAVPLLQQVIISALTPPPPPTHPGEPRRVARIPCTGGERATLMDIFIKLKRWQDFEAARLDTRKAALAGDACLSITDGFLIEPSLDTGHEFVKVIEFPAPHGEYHTRDRILLYQRKDSCSGFTPYIDLESDDADQAAFVAAHPDKAAGGDRSYSLDYYPAPDSQALLKFYKDGEPSYETLRADIMRIVAKLPSPSPTPCKSGTP
jgi:tetratricopeptide (TPR) repeat protein